MTSNPFDDHEGVYSVLRNADLQFSLWPVDVPVPNGWTAVRTAENRAACLAYIEATWTDMRPASLVEAMTAQQDGGPG